MYRPHKSGVRRSLSSPEHYHSALVDGVHAEDGRLGRVDDGGGQQAAIDSAVGDGESAASHLINADGPIPGLLAQAIDGLQGTRLQSH